MLECDHPPSVLIDSKLQLSMLRGECFLTSYAMASVLCTSYAFGYLMPVALTLQGQTVFYLKPSCTKCCAMST